MVSVPGRHGAQQQMTTWPPHAARASPPPSPPPHRPTCLYWISGRPRSAGEGVGWVERGPEKPLATRWGPHLMLHSRPRLAANQQRRTTSIRPTTPNNPTHQIGDPTDTPNYDGNGGPGGGPYGGSSGGSSRGSSRGSSGGGLPPWRRGPRRITNNPWPPGGIPPGRTFQRIPQRNLGGSPRGIPRGSPGGSPGGSPRGSPGGSPRGSPGGSPGGSPEESPRGSPRGTPK